MKTTSIEELINVVRKIRHPEDGCPWDLKQTHESLLKYLVEESYEYIQAVDEKNIDKMRDELGDVLFQVVLHSQIASESNQFNFEDVAEGIRAKMVRRHPHVFKSKDIAKTEQEVIDNWNKIKSAEKKKPYYFMEQDAYGPGLKMADEIGKKSTKVNFDWDNSSEVWEKVKEELLEVEAEYKNKNKKELEEEIGDLLFSIAQFARHEGIDPEKALFQANKKFISRIQKVESLLKEDQEDFLSVSREELEKKWVEAKS